MSDLERIVVLAGGLSPEREVSLRSGRPGPRRPGRGRRRRGRRGRRRGAAVGAARRPAQRRVPRHPRGLRRGRRDQGGTRAARRAVRGSVAGACQMAFDKPTAKALTTAAGLVTPPSVTLPRETFHDLGATAVIDLIVARLGLPLYVKPSRGGSALGAGAVRTAADLPAAVLSCFAYGDTALIERFISGTEVAVGVIDLGAGSAGAARGGDRPRRRRIRLRGPVHRGQDRVLRSGPAARRRSRTTRRGSLSPRTPCSACATCPGPTSSSTATARLVPGGQRRPRDDRDEHAAAGARGIGSSVRPHLRRPTPEQAAARGAWTPDRTAGQSSHLTGHHGHCRRRAWVPWPL